MRYRTCGECKHFVRGKAGAFGRCEKRKFLIDRHGGYQDREFVPARSRMACKDGFEESSDSTASEKK